MNEKKKDVEYLPLLLLSKNNSKFFLRKQMLIEKYNSRDCVHECTIYGDWLEKDVET